jgi:hypothetical protein
MTRQQQRQRVKELQALLLRQIGIDDLVLEKFKAYENDLNTWEYLKETGQLDADMSKPKAPSFEVLPF